MVHHGQIDGNNAEKYHPKLPVLHGGLAILGHDCHIELTGSDLYCLARSPSQLFRTRIWHLLNQTKSPSTVTTGRSGMTSRQSISVSHSLTSRSRCLLEGC